MDDVNHRLLKLGKVHPQHECKEAHQPQIANALPWACADDAENLSQTKRFTRAKAARNPICSRREEWGKQR